MPYAELHPNITPWTILPIGPQILMDLVHLRSTFEFKLVACGVLYKKVDNAPGALFHPKFTPRDTHMEADFDVFKKLGSIPETKCGTKCHENPMYRLGDDILNAPFPPISPHKSPNRAQILMCVIHLSWAPAINLVSKLHLNTVNRWGDNAEGALLHANSTP